MKKPGILILALAIILAFVSSCSISFTANRYGGGRKTCSTTNKTETTKNPEHKINDVGK